MAAASRDDRIMFEEMYRSGHTPWDTGRPDENLKSVLPELHVQGTKALEVGCGTGDNAVFLAQQGFEVAATEIVPAALEKAAEKADAAGARISFHLVDVTEEDVPGAPFHLAFDRGCFHHFQDHEKRRLFASRIAEHLAPGGIWVSLSGNADEKRPGPGPPQLSALDIVQAVEPFFEILLLKSSSFDSDMEPPPRCWVLIAKKREP